VSRGGMMMDKIREPAIAKATGLRHSTIGIDISFLMSAKWFHLFGADLTNYLKIRMEKEGFRLNTSKMFHWGCGMLA
jgi:hypothetical protein